LKKIKQIERVEENVRSQMSQTLKTSYMNDKSKRLLEQRGLRLNSAQREHDPLEVGQI
jgi:hypothetical protein